MQQNHVREHCSQCGSSNIYLVERPMSPCDGARDDSSRVGPLLSNLLLALHERKLQAEKARQAVQLSQM